MFGTRVRFTLARLSVNSSEPTGQYFLFASVVDVGLSLLVGETVPEHEAARKLKQAMAISAIFLNISVAKSNGGTLVT